MDHIVAVMYYDLHPIFLHIVESAFLLDFEVIGMVKILKPHTKQDG